MATFKIYKETALPGTLEANAVYLVGPAANPDYLEVYVVNSAGNATRHTPTRAEIDGWIDLKIASLSAMEIVADIAARDALTLTANSMVLVEDASGDATVTSGAALYAYKQSTASFSKVSEYESLDVVLAWANIQDKPTSLVADIDDAVTKRHVHANKTELDKIGEDGDGDPQYDSVNIVMTGGISW